MNVCHHVDGVAESRVVRKLVEEFLVGIEHAAEDHGHCLHDVGACNHYRVGRLVAYGDEKVEVFLVHFLVEYALCLRHLVVVVPTLTAEIAVGEAHLVAQLFELVLESLAHVVVAAVALFLREDDVNVVLRFVLASED